MDKFLYYGVNMKKLLLSIMLLSTLLYAKNDFNIMVEYEHQSIIDKIVIIDNDSSFDLNFVNELQDKNIYMEFLSIKNETYIKLSYVESHFFYLKKNIDKKLIDFLKFRYSLINSYKDLVAWNYFEHNKQLFIEIDKENYFIIKNYLKIQRYI